MIKEQFDDVGYGHPVKFEIHSGQALMEVSPKARISCKCNERSPHFDQRMKVENLTATDCQIPDSSIDPGEGLQIVKKAV